MKLFINEVFLSINSNSFELFDLNIAESPVKERQENFENVDAYQVMYDSFVIKFKNHFSVTLKADIKSFINTFEALLNQHITKNMKEGDKDYFTKELIEKYLIYVLRRLTIKVLVFINF